MNERSNKRELLRMVALITLAWVAILLGLTRWQRSRPANIQSEPQLIHYPGTEAAPEQTSTNLGLRKYWFRLDEEYPSKSAFYFYQEELEPKGWKRLGSREPEWARTIAKDGTRDLFDAVWVSPDRLFTLELQMMSVVKPLKGVSSLTAEEREPGIEVFVTLRRSLHPGILLGK